MAVTTQTVPIAPRLVSEKDLPAAARWMEEIRRFLNARLGFLKLETVTFQPLHSPPFLAEEGMVAYADGSDWDPDLTGLGGLFLYNGTTWRLISR